MIFATIVVTILLIAIALCVIAGIKNQITYKIRVSWIKEIHNRSDWQELCKLFDKISYNDVFFDIRMWREISFEEYLKKKGKKVD